MAQLISSSYLCLICKEELKLPTSINKCNTNQEENEEERNKKCNNEKAFQVFCDYFNVTTPSYFEDVLKNLQSNNISNNDDDDEGQNVSKLLFFCESCKKDVIQLYSLHEKLENIQQLIRLMTTKINSNIQKTAEEPIIIKNENQSDPIEDTLQIKLEIDPEDRIISNNNNNQQLESFIPNVPQSLKRSANFQDTSSSPSKRLKITSSSFDSNNSNNNNNDNSKSILQRIGEMCTAPSFLTFNDDSTNTISSGSKEIGIPYMLDLEPQPDLFKKKEKVRRKRLSKPLFPSFSAALVKSQKRIPRSSVLPIGDNYFTYHGHEFLLTSENTFFCSTCGITKTKRRNMIDHIRRNHVTKDENQCDNCGKILRSLKTLKIHIENKVCEVGARSKWKSIKDEETGQYSLLFDNTWPIALIGKPGCKYGDPGVQFRCETCTKQTTTREQILRHLKKEHIINFPPRPNQSNFDTDDEEMGEEEEEEEIVVDDNDGNISVQIRSGPLDNFYDEGEEEEINRNITATTTTTDGRDLKILPYEPIL